VTEAIRRQLILVAALQLGPTPEDRASVKCAFVLCRAMRRVGVWDDAVAPDWCHGVEEVPGGPVFTLWYSTLIAMTQYGAEQPWLFEGKGNLIEPAGAYFTECRLTDAGLNAAMAALAQHSQWRAEPAEAP
jgi:hypothetical protein